MTQGRVIKAKSCADCPRPHANANVRPPARTALNSHRKKGLTQKRTKLSKETMRRRPQDAADK
ncbi:MAG: hypothetical protein WCE94_01490 [Candidatus Methanoperedens sp.]